MSLSGPKSITDIFLLLKYIYTFSNWNFWLVIEDAQRYSSPNSKYYWIHQRHNSISQNFSAPSIL